MINFGEILLINILFVFNLIIGANEKGLRLLPISFLMGLIIIYLILYKLKNKKESIFIKSKIDYFVLFFMLTTTLAFIFGKSCSYSDNTEFIMKYFFIYSVYILGRNVIKTKKQVEHIITATLIFSLIPIILKLFTFDLFKNIIKFLNLDYVNSHEFFATFGYSNTLAAYLGFCIFLSIYKFKTNNNILLKILDILYILFILVIIYKTESKAIMLLIGIILLILILVKYKKQIIENKIKYIILTLVFVLFLIVYLIIALNTSKSITIKGTELDQFIRYRFKKNIEYTFEIELEAKTTTNSRFEIQLVEGGKYFNEKIIKKYFIDNYSGIYGIKFTLENDRNYVKLKILNEEPGTITLNKCFINGEEVIINYKYIPNELAYIFNGYFINGKSLYQRKYMWQDCLKIAKQSPIIGNGGNAWKVMSRAVEDYTSGYKETHSYFFELLISYGIIGTISFLIMIIYFFIIMFRKCKDDKLYILLGLFIILLHSITFDFNMSFMLIQIIVYLYMAILLYDEKKYENKLIFKVFDVIAIIFLVFIFSLYVRASISKYLIKNNYQKYEISKYNKQYYLNVLIDDSNKTEKRDSVLNNIQNLINREPYFKQNTLYNLYFRVIENNIDYIENQNLQNYLNYIINIYKNINFQTPMFFDTVLTRTKILVNNIQFLENYKNTVIDDNNRYKILDNAIIELKNIVNKEYEINVININDYERSGYDKYMKKIFFEKYNNMINSIK